MVPQELQLEHRHVRVDTVLGRRPCPGVLFAAALCAVVGCQKDSPEPAPEPTEVEQDWQKMADEWEYPQPIPDFHLVSQEGKRFGLAELSQSYVLVGFVFTRCTVPKACPLTMQKMRQVQQLWSERQRAGKTGGRSLHMLSLSIDPDHDQPAILKRYGRSYDVDFSSWTLASGPHKLLQDEIPAMFGVIALERGDGDISHGVKMALLAPGLKAVDEWDNNNVEPEQIVERVLGGGGSGASPHVGDASRQPE